LLSLAMLSAAVAGGMSSARADDGLAADGMAQPAAEKALAGQSWRLVQILSMDDTTYAPEERSNYTLTFTADGDVQIRADCNRGIGSWESLTPGALTFGEIAATRAMCPPGSLHDRFMAQFPRVRSYVVQGGHLFLATMADGSIIELEPAPLAATVLGEAVYTGDAEELQQIVLTRLFDHFAAQQGIAVTDAEIDDYVEHMRREMQAQGLHAEDDLTQEEAAMVLPPVEHQPQRHGSYWKPPERAGDTVQEEAGDQTPECRYRDQQQGKSLWQEGPDGECGDRGWVGRRTKQLEPREVAIGGKAGERIEQDSHRQHRVA